METKNIELNKEYWNKFYKSNFKHTPSQFCVCVLTEIPDDVVILELGSGNGRDSLYFASQGYRTVAVDLSSQAIASCKNASIERNIEHVSFIQADLSKITDVQKVVTIARSKSVNANIVFYSRFVMHSLDDTQELEFLKNLSNNMQVDELVYFEFRSKEDAQLDKYFGGHYRRYIDTEHFIQRLKSLNLKINYKLVGQGMAKYKEEDPFVARIIAQKL